MMVDVNYFQLLNKNYQFIYPNSIVQTLYNTSMLYLINSKFDGSLCDCKMVNLYE